MIIYVDKLKGLQKAKKTIGQFLTLVGVLRQRACESCVQVRYFVLLASLPF